MTTLLLTHPTCLEHHPGAGHPERAERLTSILARLHDAPVPGTVWEQAPLATRAQLERVHHASLVDAVFEADGHRAFLDEDTRTSAQSVRAALFAAGAMVRAVDAVLDGSANNAFALVRPPGHHATPDRAMGFCLFNNVAVAAAHALARGLQRVMVVDWDVHHGNGTQDAFFARQDVLFCSTHQFPFHPGTGAAQETGRGAGAGFTVNIPLPHGAQDGDAAGAMARVIMPIAAQYRPQLVLVSAGFDAHVLDPLGQLEWTTAGFAALCGAVKDIAAAHAEGRLVLALEGGYHTGALAECVAACVEVLAGAVPPPLHPNVQRGAANLDQVVAVQQGFWKL